MGDTRLNLISSLPTTNHNSAMVRIARIQRKSQKKKYLKVPAIICIICSHLLVTKFLETETLRAANNKPTMRQISLLFGEIILYVHCSSHCYTFTLLQAHDNSFYTAMLSHVGVHSTHCTCTRGITAVCTWH